MASYSLHASDHAVLNVHHIQAPSFCGEHEILQDTPTRVHTAVCTSPGTVVMAAPASVFKALVLSEASRRSYSTSTRLAAACDARQKWCVARSKWHQTSVC